MPTRRFVLLALAVGVPVGIGLTWPLVRHPTTTILDDGTYDAFQFVWNLWWVREALVELHANPFFTRYLFYPQGASLLFHTFSATLGFLSVPLQLVLPGGVVTAHNVLVMAAPALIVVMTALLAREVTGDPWAALAAGLVAAVNVAMAWFVPILYLSSTWLVAALLWAWWRLHRRRRWPDVALVVVLLLALVFASQEYAMMALTLLGIDSAARVLVPRLFGLPRVWWPGLVGAWAGIGAVTLALALLALGSPAQGLPDRAVLHGSGFLLGFFRPPWLFGIDLFRFWYILYLGTAPLLLVAVTGWMAGRRAAFFLLLLVWTLLMACGPYLSFRPPLAHPDPPSIWQWEPGWVPGPYWVLLRLVSLVRYFRAVYRWVNVGHVLLGVLVALGLAALRARIPRAGLRRAVTAAALALVVGLGAFDVHALRGPIVPAVVPAAFDPIAADPAPCAVIELPTGLTSWIFTNFASRHMFHQTVHRKYLLDGTVARIPVGAQRLVGRRIASFAEVPAVKYVVIHRDLVGSAGVMGLLQLGEFETLVEREGERLPGDGPIEVYRLRTFRPDAVQSGT